MASDPKTRSSNAVLSAAGALGGPASSDDGGLPTTAPAAGGIPDRLPGPGALIGPYQIESQIGAGGMGVVYKARDTRLGRNVAIKVIRSHAASTRLEAALLREARLASSLNHSGIVTIYDILQDRGTTCIVMEFVQGSPLHQLIPPGGFPLERALSLATGIAEALAVAHAAGVIHRDLKPSNILVRDDGQIKILDFGLAKLSAVSGADADDTSLFSGSTVGTVGYMSPEQARAEEVDERADIFSFGVILCELLIGKRPFGGGNQTAVLSAMLTQEPASLRSAKPEIPAALDTVLGRALAKTRAQRYQTIRELLADLNSAVRIAPPSGSSIIAPMQPAARSIAVLPLINMSPDRESDYICDGLAEELIDGLMQISGLRVVSRSSSFQFKGTTPDVRDVGKRLNTKLVVHGSLRRSGDNLRLSMQLSDSDEGVQIWSQRFDAQVGDLFALEDQLTAAVLEKLREQLGARPSEVALPERHMPSAEAYDLYLQARFAFNRETPADFRRALDLFLRSAKADPTFAPAFIGIAETHMRFDWYGLEAAAEAVPAVKSALSTALGIEPDSVSGLCNLALMQAGWDWNWEAAAESFKRALAAGEGSATVHFHYGLDYLTPQGLLAKALKHLRFAQQLDPLSPIVNTGVGGCLYRMRQWDESAEVLRNTLKANPEFGHAHWSLGRTLLEQDQGEEALKHFEEAIKLMGPIPAAVAELGYGYARTGQPNLAHGTLQELQRLGEKTWVSPINSALIYAGLGEIDAAMTRLEDALDKRIRQLVWVNVDPRFDPLRRNERFEQLIARIGLRPLEA